MHFINSCIRTASFPDNLKNALITPVIKDSRLDSENLKNYRPISNLPFLSKILERVLYIQLEHYIEQQHLYANFQSAYRKNNSCETALLRVMNDIQQEMFNKNHVALLLLDSSSAFDTVDHRILLRKLKYEFYIGNKSLNMIKSFLENRSFSVIINESSSEPRPLHYGVPQGSLLGPLMYSLYTKELEEIVLDSGMRINSYADDVQIFISFSSCHANDTNSKMTNCLKRIKEWMDLNYLKLNPEKTQLKLFKPNNEILPFQINYLGQTVDPINEINILGVRLINDLELTAFISKKVRSCNMQLRNLNHIRNSIPFNSRKTLIINTIISQLDYCNSILACVYPTALRPLELILNRAIRFIFGINRFTHITPYMKKIHILPIRFRILFKLCLTAYKIFYREAPDHLIMEFPKFEKNPDLNLREGSGRDKFMFKIEVPKHKKESIFYKIKKEWNSLPISLRKINNIPRFKKDLKTYLFRKAFD